MLPAGTLSGTVSLYPTANLEDVEITVGLMTISPDNTGSFSKNVPVGIFDVIASREGYKTTTIENVEFFEDRVTSLTIDLQALPAPANHRDGGSRRHRP